MTHSFCLSENNKQVSLSPSTTAAAPLGFPFGDHPSNLERYGEDLHVAVVRSSTILIVLRGPLNDWNAADELRM